MKSIKELAGLEELRVDLCSIITCLDDTQFSKDQASFVYQFILAERLLRYAIEGVPKITYDSISSKILFNFLLQHKAIYVKDSQLYLTNIVSDCLRELLYNINAIEDQIYYRSEKEVQKMLLNFVHSYTNF